MFNTSDEIITPTDQESRIALASSKVLIPLLQQDGSGETHIQFYSEGGQGTDIILPRSAVRVHVRALQEMAKGHTVTLIPVDTELTTNQAAELMRVSRPSLIKMLDERKLPYRKIGTARRVRYEDVIRQLETERARRRAVMEELVAETERLGLYK